MCIYLILITEHREIIYSKILFIGNIQLKYVIKY